MITIELMGGLGNQLFQIFALINYAIENRTPFYFEEKEIHHGPRTKQYWNTVLDHAAQFKKPVKSIVQVVREQQFHYKKLSPFNTNNNTKMIGYFQSYKYFELHYENIMKFTGLDKKKELFETSYDYENIVSLHFRVGDYKQLQDHHPLMSIEYYEKSLDKIILETCRNDWTILYFCEDEDIDYVNERIAILQDKYKSLTFIKIDSNYDDWEQMLIMSLCSHNIIANSSFSWWGAYLNTNDKLVCYPELWFGPKQGTKNMLDAFPESWNQISIE